MTVFGNVEYGLHSRADRQRAARSFLELFHVAQFADRRPESLSGGERQRVALARTLAVEPRALLLDEPLSALDAETTQSIIADLRTWNAERRIPIVYVTHSLQEALGLADAVVVLRSGSIIRQGSPTEVLATERHSLLQMLC